MRWNISCHPISFSPNRKIVQSIPASRPLQGSLHEAREALARIVNTQRLGQEHPLVDFSLIDHLLTQHPSQNRVPQDLQLRLQTHRPSRPVENRRLVIIKKILKRYHQRLCQHHLSILPRNLNHARVLHLGGQRNVRFLISCTFLMMESLGSSHSHHADCLYTRQCNKLLWSHSSSRTLNSFRVQYKGTRNLLRKKPLQSMRLTP